MCPQSQIPGAGPEPKSESSTQVPCAMQLAGSELDSANDSIPSHGIPYRSILYDEAIANCRSAQRVPRRLPLFLELPEQRDIDLNLTRSARAWSIDWGRSENVEAVLMQLTGTLANTPCDRCVRGLGPFQGCVVSEVCGLGACANCYYGSNRERCNLRNKAAKPQDSVQSVAPASASATAPTTPAQRLDVPAPSTPAAALAQTVIAAIFIPPVIPAQMPSQDKRALARRLREVADMYDQSASYDDLAHLGA